MAKRATHVLSFGQEIVEAEQVGASGYALEEVRQGMAPYGIPCGIDPVSGQVKLLKVVHVAGIGSTGSGKTVSLAAPTVCAAASSVERPTLAVFDIKGDLFTQTAAYVASRGYKVHHLNIYGFKNGEASDRFNPLDLPFRLLQEGKVEEAEDMIASLYGALFSSLESEKDPFWTIKSPEIMAAASLVLMDRTREREAAPTIAEVLKLTCGPEMKFRMLVNNCSDPIRQRAESALVAGSSCRNDLIAFMQGACSFFAGAFGGKLTSASSFSYEDVFAQDGPRAFYFSLPENASDSVKAFVAMIMDTLLGYYVSHQCLHPGCRKMAAVLDEFSSYPKSASGGVVDLLSTARSRGLYINLFLQSSEQMMGGRKYDRHEALAALAQCRTLFLFNSSAEMERDLMTGRGGMSSDAARRLSYYNAGECAVLNNLDNYCGQRVQLPQLADYQAAGLFVTDEPLPQVGAEFDDEADWDDSDEYDESLSLVERIIAADMESLATETDSSKDDEDDEDDECDDDEEEGDWEISMYGYKPDHSLEAYNVAMHPPAGYEFINEEGEDSELVTKVKQGDDLVMCRVRLACAGMAPSFSMDRHEEYGQLAKDLIRLANQEVCGECAYDVGMVKRSLISLIRTIQRGMLEQTSKIDQGEASVDRAFVELSRVLFIIESAMDGKDERICKEAACSPYAEKLARWIAPFVADHCKEEIAEALATASSWYGSGRIRRIWWALRRGIPRTELSFSDLELLE